VRGKSVKTGLPPDGAGKSGSRCARRLINQSRRVVEVTILLVLCSLKRHPVVQQGSETPRYLNAVSTRRKPGEPCWQSGSNQQLQHHHEPTLSFPGRKRCPSANFRSFPTQPADHPAPKTFSSGAIQHRRVRPRATLKVTSLMDSRKHRHLDHLPTVLQFDTPAARHLLDTARGTRNIFRRHLSAPWPPQRVLETPQSLGGPRPASCLEVCRIGSHRSSPHQQMDAGDPGLITMRRKSELGSTSASTGHRTASVSGTNHRSRD